MIDLDLLKTLEGVRQRLIDTGATKPDPKPNAEVAADYINAEIIRKALEGKP